VLAQLNTDATVEELMGVSEKTRAKIEELTTAVAALEAASQTLAAFRHLGVNT